MPERGEATARAAAGDAPGSFWAAFLRGLTRPSLPALVLTLLVPLAGFLGLTFGITPRLIASSTQYVLAIDAQDTDLFSMAGATRLGLEGLRGPTVMLIGSSTMLRAVPHPEELGQEVAREVGHPAVVEQLACDGSTILQMESLVALLPAHFDGVVVLEITSRTLTLVPSDLPVRTIQAPPGDWPGVYFWRNLRFFLPRISSIPRNLRNGAIHYQPAEWLVARMTESGWQEAAGRLRRSIGPDYLEQREQCYEVLARIVARLRASGDVRVALLQNPLSERGYQEVLGPAFWDEHRARLRRFADERALPLWRLDEEAGLVEQDFADFMHLYRPEAQAHFVRALASHVTELWKERP